VRRPFPAAAKQSQQPHCRIKHGNRRALSTLAIATGREFFDLLRDDLVAIEQELGRDAASSVSTITEIAEYLREGGGKRIRPSLLLLSAHLLGYSGQGSIRLGAVVEMVHTATLVHDDIIDDADTRRAGLPPTLPGATRNACWPATGFTCRPSKWLWKRRICVCSSC